MQLNTSIFNLLVSIFSISIPVWILIILGFLMAFSITWFTIPSVVNISRLKNLCNKPNIRTSHAGTIPTLGGIAIFIGLVMSTIIIAGTYFKFELKYIITGLIIVLFIGMKDDLLIIDPWKKLIGQIFAAVIISVLADIRITNFYGLLGIDQIPYIASILFTIIVFIVIINGFNLIDGIDGLASGIGILASSVFGIWFWINGNIAYTMFSFSFAGSLSAFFYFNVFDNENKIFLGDAGSLLTGLVLGVLACRFLQIDLVTDGAAHIQSAPAVVFGILIVPLFDSLRVFTMRIVQSKSPFRDDRQHIHHLLLQMGYSHLQATLILIFVNLLFIGLSFLLQGIGILWLMITILGLACLMSYILLVLVMQKTRKVLHSENTVGTIRKRINRKRSIKEKPPVNKTLPSPSKKNTDKD